MSGRASRPQYPFVYAWGNNPKRATFKGRRCRILARGTLRSILIEFENGERTVTSARALRSGRASRPNTGGPHTEGAEQSVSQP